MAYFIYNLGPGNLKISKLILRVLPLYLLIPDKSSKTCIAQRGLVGVQLLQPPFDNQFHPAVGQVADSADDFKTGGHGLGGVTEADPLHLAGVMHRQTAA